MMQAFTAGGLNTFGDIQHITEEGPINVKLAKSLALQQANGEPVIQEQVRNGVSVRMAVLYLTIHGGDGSELAY